MEPEGRADCIEGRGTTVSGENVTRWPEELREAQLIQINEGMVIMERMKMAQGKGCLQKPPTKGILGDVSWHWKGKG